MKWSDWVTIAVFAVITIFVGIKVYYWSADYMDKAHERQEFMRRFHGGQPTPTPLEEFGYEIGINDLKYEINIKRVK